MGALRRASSLAAALALSLVQANAAENVAAGELRLRHLTFVPRGSSQGDALAAASLRLKLERRQAEWSGEFHYLLELQRGPEAADGPGGQPRSLFDWESGSGDSEDGSVAHRIDRLSVAYAKGAHALRIGRQAVTWGRGIHYRPLDLFNPFSPDSFDTSYKPGTDMVRYQRLFDGGEDLQALLVPRRDAEGFSWSVSSAAVKGYFPTNSSELEFTLASDYGSAVLGLGASVPAGGSLWGFDLVLHSHPGRAAALTGIANVRTSWTWDERPVIASAEYYRNGFGVDSLDRGEELPEALTERMQRGQVFVEGRDHFALGASVEWTPLLTIAPALLLNLNDRSAQLVLDASYSVSSDLAVAAGLRVPMGAPGSEFGGRHSQEGGEPADPQPVVHMMLEMHF